VNYGSGRALVVLKAAIVDAEFGKLDLKLADATRHKPHRVDDSL